MNFVEPTWWLNKVCPVCRQGSSLSFSTCNNCKKVVLHCEEEGTLFPDPKNLKKFVSDEWNYSCPHCKETGSLESSTSDEIQAFGFSVGEYC
jgi:hypothetical protein